MVLDKSESFEFIKASGSDSEFEHIDDFVDEAEEGDIGSKVIQMGIGVLNYNMIQAEKYRAQNPNFQTKVTLLSRASSLL